MGRLIWFLQKKPLGKIFTSQLRDLYLSLSRTGQGCHRRFLRWNWTMIQPGGRQRSPQASEKIFCLLLLEQALQVSFSLLLSLLMLPPILQLDSIRSQLISQLLTLLYFLNQLFLSHLHVAPIFLFHFLILQLFLSHWLAVLLSLSQFLAILLSLSQSLVVPQLFNFPIILVLPTPIPVLTLLSINSLNFPSQLLHWFFIRGLRSLLKLRLSQAQLVRLYFH